MALEYITQSLQPRWQVLLHLELAHHLRQLVLLPECVLLVQDVSLLRITHTIPAALLPVLI